jgi:hypothetical protein
MRSFEMPTTSVSSERIRPLAEGLCGAALPIRDSQCAVEASHVGRQMVA